MITSSDQKNFNPHVFLDDRHKELADHQQIAFLDKLKKFLLSHESVNKRGLTFLQQAAREGMLEIALRLLQRGAFLKPKAIPDKEFQNFDVKSVEEGTRKTPYEFARERGHHLLADVLAVCSTNPMSMVDRNIRNAVLFWLVENDTADAVLRFWELQGLEKAAPVADVKTSLLSDEKNSAVIPEETLSRFVEFAAFRRNSELVASLLKAGKLKNDSAYFSAGYWAVITNNSETSRLVCTDDDAVILKLRQLDATGKSALFSAHHDAATVDQRYKYSESEIEIATDSNALSPKQKKIYQAAALGSSDTMQRLKPELQDFAFCIAHAWKKQSYVALYELKKLVNIEFILQWSCVEQNKDFTRFWLIVNNIDPFEFVLKHQKDAELVKFIMEACSSVTGFLHYIISRNAKRQPSKRQAEELNLLNVIFDKDRFLLNVILKCLNDSDPDEIFAALLSSKELSLELRARDLSVPSHIKRLMQHRMQRLGLKIALSKEDEVSSIINFSTLPKPLYKKINTWLSLQDSAKFLRVSSTVHDAMAYRSNDSEGQFNELSRQRNLITRFEAAVAASVDQKNCTSDRICCDINYAYRCNCSSAWGTPSNRPEPFNDCEYYATITLSGLGIICLGISPWMSVWLNGTMSHRRDLCNEFQTTMVPPQNSWDYPYSCYDLQIGHEYPDSCLSVPSCNGFLNSECADLCARLLALELTGVGEGFGAALTAVFAFFALLAIWRLSDFIRGRERFDLMTPDQYPDDVLEAVKELFSESNSKAQLTVALNKKLKDAKSDSKVDAKSDSKALSKQLPPLDIHSSDINFSGLSTASTMGAIKARAEVVKQQIDPMLIILGKKAESERLIRKTQALARAAVQFQSTGRDEKAITSSLDEPDEVKSIDTSVQSARFSSAASGTVANAGYFAITIKPATKSAALEAAQNALQPLLSSK